MTLVLTAGILTISFSTLSPSNGLSLWQARRAAKQIKNPVRKLCTDQQISKSFWHHQDLYHSVLYSVRRWCNRSNGHFFASSRSYRTYLVKKWAGSLYSVSFYPGEQRPVYCTLNWNNLHGNDSNLLRETIITVYFDLSRQYNAALQPNPWHEEAEGA